MHELAVTESIVEACCERAGGTPVLRVTLEIGMLSCVLPDALYFCFDVVTRDTVLEGAQLVIDTVPGQSRCRDCGREVVMPNLLAACSCGSHNLEPPRGGDQLKIRSMEIEEAA